MTAFAAFLACCERHDEGPRAATHPAASAESRETLQQVLGLDATRPPGVDPPPPPGDFRQDVETFTSLDECVERRRSIDPLLGDALEAIGYDTFLVDACRVLEAAKSRDRRRCAAIAASPLRSRCEASVAQITGDADACPWDIPERPERGRDPTCVAVASGDPRLCGSAEDPLARAVCTSIAAGDDKVCAALPSSLDRARCSRDASRWRSAARANTAPAEAFAATGRLHLDPPKTLGISPLDQDVTVDVARGVVLNAGATGARFVIGAFDDAGSGFLGSSPHAPAKLSLEIRVAPGGAVVERAQVSAPSRPSVSTPPAHSTLRVAVEKAGKSRADPVWISVDGDIGDGSAPWHLHASLRTFVRDVVGPRDFDRSRGSSGAPELGQDGQLR